MDQFILQWINGFAGRNLWLDTLGIIISEYLIIALPIIIFLVYFLTQKKNLFPIFGKILLGLFLVFCLNYLISEVVARPRPFIEDETIYQLSKFSAKKTDYSFPSYHSSIAFVFALIIFLDKKKFGIFLLISAFLIGLTRIFSGIHYPSDIFAGFLTALASVFILNYLVKKFIDFNKLKIS